MTLYGLTQTERASQIFQPNQKPCLLVNNGPGNLVCGNSSAINANSYGFALSAGAPITWPGGELFAFAAGGDVTYNVLQNDDSSPVPVLSADAIATNIFETGVKITNDPKFLGNIRTSTVTTIPGTDFTTLKIVGSALAGSSVYFIVDQYVDAIGGVNNVDERIFFVQGQTGSTNGDSLSVTIPCIGDIVTITTNIIGPNASLDVFGLYVQSLTKAVRNADMLHHTVVSGAGFIDRVDLTQMEELTSVQWQAASTSDTVVYILELDHKQGPAIISVFNPTGQAFPSIVWRLEFADLFGNNWMGVVAEAATAWPISRLVSAPVNLPSGRIRLVVENVSSSNPAIPTLVFSLQMV